MKLFIVKVSFADHGGCMIEYYTLLASSRCAAGTQIEAMFSHCNISEDVADRWRDDSVYYSIRESDDPMVPNFVTDTYEGKDEK